MSRPLRIVFPGAYHYLMNRGLTWQEIFTDLYVIRVVQPGPADYLVTQTIVIDPEGNPTSNRDQSVGLDFSTYARSIT